MMNKYYDEYTKTNLLCRWVNLRYTSPQYNNHYVHVVWTEDFFLQGKMQKMFGR